MARQLLYVRPMRRPKALQTALASALGVSLLVAGAGCVASVPDSSEQDLKGESERTFSGHTELQVPLDHSPSGGSTFDFCYDVPPGQLDTNQAAWLGFFAANEYAHFGYVGPMLVELGFGNPHHNEYSWDAGLDYIWDECGIDLDRVRADGETNARELARASESGPAAMLDYVEERLEPGHPAGWGVCAQRWYELSGWEADTHPAPAFEQWLIQTHHPGDYIQFFSGGEFAMGGAFFKEGTTQVQFMRHREQPIAIVSFRGTEPDKWLDVVTDAIAWQVDVQGGGQVHSGFLNAYETVEPFLEATVGDLETTGVNIYVTGHSLGAALATLFTRRLLELKEQGADLEVRGMYNMGSPRVGDTEFQERFDALAAKHSVNVMRIRNQNDVVTRIPSIQDWSHINQLVYMTEGELGLPEEDPRYKWLGSVADHSMKNYYLRLAHHMRDPVYAQFRHCP